MSGHKRALVTLSEADLRKLAGVEERLRRVEQDYQHIRRRARQDGEAELRQGLHELRTRQGAFQAALGGLEGSLAAVEAQAAQALLAQAEEAQAELAAGFAGLGQALWQETAAVLETHGQALADLVAQGQAERQGQLADLEQQLLSAHAGRQELARQALEVACALHAALEQDGAHQRYYPGALASLGAELELAGHNLEAGLAEAALVGAQGAYLRLAGLRQELEARRWQRRCLLAAARARLRQVYERGRQLAQVPAVDLDGHELAAQVDVDYWSGGAYRAALTRCRGLLGQLAAGGAALDEGELVALHNDTLPQVEAALSEAVYQARGAVLASQLRYNLAACVVAALSAQGFTLAAGAYRGQDPRQAYQLRLVHYDGSEVLVQVQPLAGEVGANALDLVSLDGEQRTAHELRQRARELARALQGYGLQVGPVAAAGQGDGLPLPARRTVAERQASYGRD
jgi:hypothetical protein